MITCNESLFDEEIQTYVKTLGVALSNLFCFDINSPNLSGNQIIVSNNFGTINSRTLHIYVQKCDEVADPGCAAILDKGFDNLTLNISTINYNVDISNYEEPISPLTVATVVK